MAHVDPALTVEISGRRWRVGAQAYDLSIPLAFDGAQPSFFGAPRAAGTPLLAGSFVGDVNRGGSVNCSTHTLTPHCNGTHTECVGHITRERVSVRDAAVDHLSVALLVTLSPAEASAEHREVTQPGDRIITAALLAAAVAPHDLSDYSALVVRTLPNDDTKRHRDYDLAGPAPYFTADAMRWIVQHGVQSLVVDLPTLDRADDARLTTHRIFWGLPPGATSAALAARPQATVTELAYVAGAIADGPYLLNLQIAPFVADAAPSRPVVLPLVPA